MSDHFARAMTSVADERDRLRKVNAALLAFAECERAYDESSPYNTNELVRVLEAHGFTPTPESTLGSAAAFVRSLRTRALDLAKGDAP